MAEIHRVCNFTKKTTVKLGLPWPRQAIKTKAEEEVKNAKILGRERYEKHFFSHG